MVETIKAECQGLCFKWFPIRKQLSGKTSAMKMFLTLRKRKVERKLISGFSFGHLRQQELWTFWMLDSKTRSSDCDCS